MSGYLAFGCARKLGKVNAKSLKFLINKTASTCSRRLHNMGKAKWNININNNNFVSSRDRVICSDRFQADSFQEGLDIRLLPEQLGSELPQLDVYFFKK